MSRNWGRIIYKKEKQRTGTEETGAEAGILCLFFWMTSGFALGKADLLSDRDWL